MSGNKLAFCIIIKNEHYYIEEWLEHHFKLGADRIFVFDNDENSHREIVKPWIETGQVIHLRWLPIYFKQITAYECCLQGWGREFDWIAFIDTDEFIMPTNGLKDYLAANKDCPAIRLKWRLYGANGHVARPLGGVVDNYTKSCGPVPTIFTMPFKTILNTRFAPDCIFTVNQITHYQAKENASYWINHYITKSWEDWKARLKRGQVSGGQPPGDFFDYNPEMEPQKIILLDSIPKGESMPEEKRNLPSTFYAQMKQENPDSVAEFAKFYKGSEFGLERMVSAIVNHMEVVNDKWLPLNSQVIAGRLDCSIELVDKVVEARKKRPMPAPIHPRPPLVAKEPGPPRPARPER